MIPARVPVTAHIGVERLAVDAIAMDVTPAQLARDHDTRNTGIEPVSQARAPGPPIGRACDRAGPPPRRPVTRRAPSRGAPAGRAVPGRLPGIGRKMGRFPIPGRLPIPGQLPMPGRNPGRLPSPGRRNCTTCTAPSTASGFSAEAAAMGAAQSWLSHEGRKPETSRDKPPSHIACSHLSRPIQYLTTRLAKAPVQPLTRAGPRAFRPAPGSE